ncbi:hypothetical protein AB0M57_19920 [Streptomyces sp. NPDC051597]|uniref:hypothetical protein n=1 Tax=Streptomyces sp. NPDC051597 TaxID=3155049 RepID=UPI0034376551
MPDDALASGTGAANAQQTRSRQLRRNYARDSRSQQPACEFRLTSVQESQNPRASARISVKITPLHSDDTECTHAIRPSGQPRDADSGCNGRRNYAVVCNACGPIGQPHGLRVLAEPAQSAPHDSHKAALAPSTY